MLDTWDPENLPPCFSMGIIAKRRSGKSTLIKSLCYHYWRKQFPMVYTFSQTIFNGFYQDFIPEGYLFEGYDESKINEIIARQQSLVTLMAKFPPSERENIQCLIILDDIDMVKYSNSLQRLLLQGRHLQISLVIAIQDATLISRVMRDNLDICISFKQPNKVSRERLVYSFMCSTSYSIGEEALMLATSPNFQTLVIDNTSSSYDLQDFCFVYTFDPISVPQTFPMGAGKSNYTWLLENVY